MISFKDFLTEAHSKAGFDYEKKIARILKQKGYMDPSLGVAGASASAADAYIYDNKLEIKLNKNVMFGQAELVYKNNKWDFSEKTKQTYKRTLSNLNKILKDVRTNWGAPTGNYRKDLQTFGNLYVYLNSKAIADHYAYDRDTPYIQIGGYGLYKLTEDDPANLGVPLFQPVVKVRARVKCRGSSKECYANLKYGFTVNLIATEINPKPSTVDVEKSSLPPVTKKQTK